MSLGWYREEITTTKKCTVIAIWMEFNTVDWTKSKDLLIIFVFPFLLDKKIESGQNVRLKGM